MGSIAGTGLSVGDIITKIGSYDTVNLNLNETQELIKCSGNLLQLNVIRFSILFLINTCKLYSLFFANT